MATTALEREDPTDPDSWKMSPTDLSSLERRILEGLRRKGYPATTVEMDATKLKGGYICDTMRVFIGYGTKGESAGGSPTSAKTAKAEAVARQQDDSAGDLPRSVVSRPPTLILKMASPMSNDHDVAMRLRLYEREWHFYEELSERVNIRVPKHLGSVKDEATGLITEGVLLEDLEVPGAVLCPKMDDAGVLLTVTHMAKHHSQFWNAKELGTGALGLKGHNAPWFQPGWGNDIKGYWPKFEAKWRARGPEGDAMGIGLTEEAYKVGSQIAEQFAWVQNELSSKPHTFNHGDVKPPNMFMMPGDTPAFIDWQYTAVGKGCQDIVFFLIEGYEIAECRRLEAIVMPHYHNELLKNGILDYSLDDLKRDWKLACMHFPFYVAMWFGTTPDDQLVDPGFPRRFVPRAFDAILRHSSQDILPQKLASPKREATSAFIPQDEVDLLAPLPDSLPECQKALTDLRAAAIELKRQRDAYKATIDSIANLAVKAGSTPVD